MGTRKKISIFSGGKAADFLLEGMRAEDTAGVDTIGKTLIVLGTPFSSVAAYNIVHSGEPRELLLTGGRSPGFNHFIEGRGIHFLERANRREFYGEDAPEYDTAYEQKAPESEKILGILPSKMCRWVSWSEDSTQTTYENLLAVRKSKRPLDHVIILVHELHALRALLTARHLLHGTKSIEAKTFRLPVHNDLYQHVMAKSEFYNLKKYSAKWDYVRDVVLGKIQPTDAATKTAIDFLQSEKCHFKDEAKQAAFDKFHGGRAFSPSDFAGDFLDSVDTLAPSLKFGDQKYLLDKKINPDEIGEMGRLYAAMAILSGSFWMDPATRARMEKVK